jgi:uncharacterized alkaline shock family protein YloU
MSGSDTSLGHIYISHHAIATIASQSALESYGVVGLATKNLVKGIERLLTGDPSSGVEVVYDGHSLQIDIYIIVEYGTRIKSVATSVSESICYQLEKMLVIPVIAVNVHVRGLRISNPD